MTDHRKFHATFCDDIRHEVGGKTSLIGCYSGVMYVPVFPITLARLCIHTYLSTPIDQPFMGTVALSVLKDGEVLTKTEIDGSQIVQIAQGAQGPAAPEAYIMTGGLEFAPLQLESPCILRVVAEVEGKAMLGEKLRVEILPQQA